MCNLRGVSIKRKEPRSPLEMWLPSYEEARRSQKKNPKYTKNLVTGVNPTPIQRVFFLVEKPEKTGALPSSTALAIFAYIASTSVFAKMWPYFRVKKWLGLGLQRVSRARLKRGF